MAASTAILQQGNSSLDTEEPGAWPMRRTRILLVGNYRPTLAIARALEPLGYRIVVTGTGGEGAAEHSRHIASVIPVGEMEGEGLPAFVCDGELLADAGIDMVMPVTEGACRGIAERRHMLSSRITWITPDAETVLACLDKPTIYARCNRLGIPTGSFLRTMARDLDQAVGELGFPCVVRPENSSRRIAGKKAIFVESTADLACHDLTGLPRSEPLIVQRTATGCRHNLYFAAQRGALVGICEARISRTDRTDGSGLAVEGITIEPSPGLVELTRQLVHSLGYNGIGCAQYLVDPGSGAVAFLEINPRVPGNHAIAEAAGLPLAKLALDIALDQVEPAPLIIGQAGLRFAWTYGDLRGFREALRNGDLSFGLVLSWAFRILSAGWKSHVHMTWSRADPSPTLALYARQLGLGRLASNRRPRVVLERVRRERCS